MHTSSDSQLTPTAHRVLRYTRPTPNRKEAVQQQAPPQPGSKSTGEQTSSERHRVTPSPFKSSSKQTLRHQHRRGILERKKPQEPLKLSLPAPRPVGTDHLPKAPHSLTPAKSALGALTALPAPRGKDSPVSAPSCFHSGCAQHPQHSSRDLDLLLLSLLLSGQAARVHTDPLPLGAEVGKGPWGCDAAQWGALDPTEVFYSAPGGAEDGPRA